jgi:hypothetical protein
MRGFLEYAATCVVTVALIGAIFWGFTGAAGRETVMISAGLAVVIQLLAFAVARLLQRRHLLLGWGLGSVLRLVALVLYAVVVARLGRASLTPALLSFVAFLFITTVVEPVFLRR